MPAILCQEWEESERSWGVRPDGASLHFTENERTAACDCTQLVYLLYAWSGE